MGSSMHDQPLRLKVGERFLVLLANFSVGVLGPHVLQQYDRAFPVGVIRDAGVEHLLVEGDDDIGFVAHVGHVLRSHADADAAGTLTFSRGWLDFGWNDLNGPDAVAHLAAHQSQDLAAFLCAFAGIADNFDDMLIYLANAIPSLYGSSESSTGSMTAAAALPPCWARPSRIWRETPRSLPSALRGPPPRLSVCSDRRRS